MNMFLIIAASFCGGFLTCALAVVTYSVCAISKMARESERLEESEQRDADGDDLPLFGKKEKDQPEPACSTCVMIADRCRECEGNSQYVAKDATTQAIQRRHEEFVSRDMDPREAPHA